MEKEFTKAEYDMLTMVSDKPDTFKVVIDGAGQVVMVNKLTETPVYKFGEVGADLIVRLFKSENIDVTVDDSIRVLEKLK
jgi:uncharacterized protein YhfF